LAAPVMMGVVCFRFIASNPDNLDNLNATMVERINASGIGYITQTKLRSRTVMRIGLGNILTTEQHLRNVWELIQTAANGI
jgi:glutamate/tyrosine decarboxylase-like PLP-dependent enzyme